MNQNIINWNNIYKNHGAGSFLNYPNEVLVTLFYRYRKYINLDGKCLDYGFGSGNNSEFLIQHMRQMYGSEISESAISAVNSRLSKYENFDKKLFSLEFKSDFCDFDLIIAWQVLYYNTKDSFQQALDNLVNSLKVNGILIVSLSTHKDIKVTMSKKIDKNTFVIGDFIPHQTGCTMYSPATKEEFLHFFEPYNLETLDYGYFENMSYIKSENCLSEYYLVARKK